MIYLPSESPVPHWEDGRHQSEFNWRQCWSSCCHLLPLLPLTCYFSPTPAHSPHLHQWTRSPCIVKDRHQSCGLTLTKTKTLTSVSHWSRWFTPQCFYIHRWRRYFTVTVTVTSSNWWWGILTIKDGYFPMPDIDTFFFPPACQRLALLWW